MTRLVIAAPPAESKPAQRLASLLGAPLTKIGIRRFPDGESLVSADAAGQTTIIYWSLDDPNAKLVDLALAASALRDLGARRVVLVAPYLCYMRQDRAFHPGEAVSQRVIGKLLAERFERVVTVEPHLHRTTSLDSVIRGAEATSLAASGPIADLVRADGDPARAVVVGPDREAKNWTDGLAGALGAPSVVLEKVRTGDRKVAVSAAEAPALAGRIAYIVDDVVSTGSTLIAAAQLVKEHGAERIEAIAVHALLGEDDIRRVLDAGVARLRSTDTVAHSTNAMKIAPLLADALKNEVS